jgi:NAD(P)-dependent dehydrogenase (short-subunit alcohol dehydrogenase family)
MVRWSWSPAPPAGSAGRPGWRSPSEGCGWWWPRAGSMPWRNWHGNARQPAARPCPCPPTPTDEAAVAELARRAVERFGRIDVWVNNAGVYLLGLLEATPPEAFRRVLETNFFGYVHGARAVLPRFREQGHGVLINNASVYSHVGAPWLTAYVSSKFAVRGFSEALRQESLLTCRTSTSAPCHRPRSTRPTSPALPTTAAGRSRRRHPPTRPNRWPARSWLAPCTPSGSGSWVAPAAWSP